MKRWQYCVLTYVAKLLLPLHYLKKGRKSPDYKQRWGERFGFFEVPENIEKGICFHCVSVGETVAAIPLIRKIQTNYPDLPVTVTSTTPTGSKRVVETFGDSVFHMYLPFDTPGSAKTFINKLKPHLLVIMETEIWPNLLHYAKQAGCKTLLANARLSEKSASGYAKQGELAVQTMNNFDHICAQFQADGDRFVALGFPSKRLTVTGSVKFDIKIDKGLRAQCEAFKSQWNLNRPVWVVGSTHEGEDELILDAFKQVLELHPKTLLIIVPRHPERFDQVAQLIEAENYQLLRKSTNQVPSPDDQVVLGDTMGELMSFWSIADVTFVGGSLLDGMGGHNPLEPALFAKPILSGNHVTNFKAIYELLNEKSAAVFATDPQSLAQTVINLFNDTHKSRKLGNNALDVLEQNRGALAKLQAHINALLS